MAPNIVGAQVMEAIRAAVTPGEADIVIAKTGSPDSSVGVQRA
jgi:hypothetical protein